MKRIILAVLSVILLLSLANSAFAQDFAEPLEFTVMDYPDDNGRALALSWKKMPYESKDVFYLLYMSDSEAGPFFLQSELLSTGSQRSLMPNIFGYDKDNENYHSTSVRAYLTKNEKGESVANQLESGKKYYFKIGVKGSGVESQGKVVVSASPVGNYFKVKDINNFILMLILSTGILYFINRAKRNPNIFIRKISGLEALDDALGRATEMGKPVYFVHGQATMDRLSTIAAVNILGKVAEDVAKYDTELKMATHDPVVLQVSRQTAKEAYIKAGRPDAFREENYFMPAQDQFPYAAAVNGLMVREKPAANLYFGYFYAEALLLAETGTTTGAIQIAGTDSWTQVPFFITTCDFTLIGEELYAASAYLSKEPKMLGNLKGQDFGKLVIAGILVIGTVLSSAGHIEFARWFWPL